MPEQTPESAPLALPDNPNLEWLRKQAKARLAELRLVDPNAKLSEGDMVFFVLDTVPKLDLSRFYRPYEDESRGAPPFDPAMMVCLLLYAYWALT